MSQKPCLMDGREFYSSLIRLHILHHAVQEPIFGLGVIEELARHGYKLSAGTLYPMLHEMERKGYLYSIEQRSGRQSRRLYRATDLGKMTLEDAKEKVRELFGELFEE
ncbi:PadR family transcriptional regulator [Nostoc mirabile]|uniref:PadR family transcriptional regulator n=1 Tax=Nostoc mirabile TaxID=2907820 RepID=UPI001E2C5D13|nr:helix-turn-helix transcriptional regulator [Nostoc mirabile]